jgi:probable rRNA maturation factor
VDDAMQIAVQNPGRSRRVPPAATVVRWVKHALERSIPGAITVRFVSRPEAIALNRQFRARDYAPNVLSFPYPEGRKVSGDIAVFPAIVAAEALTQGKAFEAHLAHLVVHGVLHLRGLDHVEPREAARMERLESKLVTALGHGDPWASERAPRATMRTVRFNAPA